MRIEPHSESSGCSEGTATAARPLRQKVGGWLPWPRVPVPFPGERTGCGRGCSGGFTPGMGMKLQQVYTRGPRQRTTTSRRPRQTSEEGLHTVFGVLSVDYSVECKKNNKTKQTKIKNVTTLKYPPSSGRLK